VLELPFHLSRLERLETLHLFTSLSLLRFFTLSPPLACCMSALRMLCLPAHALYGTREGGDVRCVGFFEPEVVRAFKALSDLVKLLIILEEFSVYISTSISSGRCS